MIHSWINTFSGLWEGFQGKADVRFLWGPMWFPGALCMALWPSTSLGTIWLPQLLCVLQENHEGVIDITLSTMVLSHYYGKDLGILTKWTIRTSNFLVCKLGLKGSIEWFEFLWTFLTPLLVLLARVLALITLLNLSASVLPHGKTACLLGHPRGCTEVHTSSAWHPISTNEREPWSSLTNMTFLGS